MKVVLVGGLNSAQSLWCIHRGFERAGCEVVYVPSVAHGPKGKVMRPDLHAALTAATDGAALLYWWQPQNGVDAEALEALRGRVPLVMMSMDDPYALGTPYCEGFHLFDAAVTCCRGVFDWYTERGVVPLLGYPPCDRDLHGQGKPNPEQACDMSFAVTNTYPHARFPHAVDRCEIVRAVAPLGELHLYGYWGTKGNDWKLLGDDMKGLWKGWLGYEAHPGLMAASRINLNSHVRPDGYQYLNERTTLIMASGGFHLCDRVNGIGEIFDEDREVALWGDLDELADKVRFYLGHERLRRNVAVLGQRKALAMFDNERLARQVIDAVK